MRGVNSKIEGQHIDTPIHVTDVPRLGNDDGTKFVQYLMKKLW